MLRLHERYGDVVRVAPNQVAILDPRAWRETMGHRRAGQLENGRDPVFFGLSRGGLIGPVGSEEHGRQRRILSHGFSAQSLREQQPLIQQYVDLLMLRLRENCQGGDRALDMTTWYNWTTFVGVPSCQMWKVKEKKRLTSRARQDVIGDLAFGEPFGCLSESNYHPWVTMVFQGVKQAVQLLMIRRLFPSADRFIQNHLLDHLAPKRQHHMALTQSKVEKRMAMKGDRPDFMHAMLGKHEGGKEVSRPPLSSFFSFFSSVSCGSRPHRTRTGLDWTGLDWTDNLTKLGVTCT